MKASLNRIFRLPQTLNPIKSYSQSMKQFYFRSNMRFSTVFVNHRDTADNNSQAPFDFTPENYKKVDEILVSRYSYVVSRADIPVTKKNQLLCLYCM